MARGIWTLKHVKQLRSSATKMAKRQRLEGELVGMFEGGDHQKRLLVG